MIYRAKWLIVALFPLVHQATFAQTPAPDIAGLRLGMTWAEAKVVLAKKGRSLEMPLYPQLISTNQKYIEAFGYPYQVKYQMALGNERYVISLYPKSTSAKLSDPANLIVHRVHRTLGYHPEKAPSRQTTISGLVGKFGNASEAVDVGYQLLIS
jgi:hypothetical protein